MRNLWLLITAWLSLACNFFSTFPDKAKLLYLQHHNDIITVRNDINSIPGKWLSLDHNNNVLSSFKQENVVLWQKSSLGRKPGFSRQLLHITSAEFLNLKRKSNFPVVQIKIMILTLFTSQSFFMMKNMRNDYKNLWHIKMY